MSNAVRSVLEPSGRGAPIPSESPVPSLGYACAIVGNLLFLRVLASSLRPDEFARFAGALAIALPAFVPALVAQAASAARARWLVTHGRAGETSESFDGAVRRVAMFALVVAIVVTILPVADALALDPLTVSAAPLIGGALLLQGRATGLLLGAGRTFAFALIVAAEPILRIAIAAPLLRGVEPVRGLVISTLATSVAASAFARARLPHKREVDPNAARRRPRTPLAPLETWPATAALLAWGLLAFMDVPLARLEQSPSVAADYATAAVLGRFLLLLPLPLSLVLAANTKLRLGRRLPVGAVFGRVFLLNSAALAIGILSVIFFGDRILAAFFGAKASVLSDLYAEHARSLLLYGLSLPLILFGLAAGRVTLALLAIPGLLFVSMQFSTEGRAIERCLRAMTESAVLYFVIVLVVVTVPLLRARRLAAAAAAGAEAKVDERRDTP